MQIKAEIKGILDRRNDITQLQITHNRRNSNPNPSHYQDESEA